MVSRNQEMGSVLSSQPTNANKHKKRNRTFESWIKNRGISRFQKMFFKWNVESCSRNSSSVIVSSLCRTKYPLLWWIQKISKVTTNVLKELAQKHHNHLWIRKRAVDHAMIRSVEPINISTRYSVKSSNWIELKKKEYVVDFGNEQRYCSCTCPDFKNNRMICKHFFAVIEGNHRTFNDISQLFRDHAWINLDSKLFTSSSLTKKHLKSSNNT